MPIVLILDCDGTLVCFDRQGDRSLEEKFLRASLVKEVKALKEEVIGVYGNTARCPRLAPMHTISLQQQVTQVNKSEKASGLPPRNPCELLTHRAYDNFLEAVGLKDKFVAVSTRGDMGRECGADYERLVAYEKKQIAYWEATGRFDSCIMVEGRDAREEFPGDIAKNSQTIHCIMDAIKRFGPGHTYCTFDDVGRICLLAAHLSLPKEIDLRVYHVTHGAVTFVPRMLLAGRPGCTAGETKELALPIPAAYPRREVEKLVNKLVGSFSVDSYDKEEAINRITDFLSKNCIPNLPPECIMILLRFQPLSGCCNFFNKTAYLRYDEESEPFFEAFLEAQFVKAMKAVKELKSTPISSVTVTQSVHVSMRQESTQESKQESKEVADVTLSMSLDAATTIVMGAPTPTTPLLGRR